MISMISFVTLFKIDLSDIHSSLLFALLWINLTFSFVLHIAFYRHFVQRSRATIRGWLVGHTGLYLLSLIYHLCASSVNLISAHILLAGPAVLFLPCPFTGIITYLITLFSLLLTSDTLFDIHLLFVNFLLCVVSLPVREILALCMR